MQSKAIAAPRWGAVSGEVVVRAPRKPQVAEARLPSVIVSPEYQRAATVVTDGYVTVAPRAQLGARNPIRRQESMSAYEARLQEFAHRPGSFRRFTLWVADKVSDAFETVFGGVLKGVFRLSNVLFKLSNKTADSHQTTMIAELPERASRG